MDTLSPEHRSWVMAQIHSKDTKPELVVRSWLHRRGYRFRLHVKTLPGHPDIVLPRYRALVEVRGCFWHRHPGCKTATTPSSHKRFWKDKFRRNVARDRLHEDEWRELGWHVFVIWECELAPRRREATLLALDAALAALVPARAPDYALPAAEADLPMAADAPAPEDAYKA